MQYEPQATQIPDLKNATINKNDLDRATARFSNPNQSNTNKEALCSNLSMDSGKSKHQVE
ncbi:hypothetical protein C1H46_000859 [Malus baccata]|uniref:Uncharacterized protein n=1 Tax=Malus baccata TaxID=106549 RepID=A0A540NR54_MALBA|nr:hypothetical protein C1H46_000859 [Malus baccata]